MKNHTTIPNEPEEAPVTLPKPEISQPQDPSEPNIPPEAPPREPQELPPPVIKTPEVPPL
jgi:hypothetical protein